jgi:two-component system, chemotaxis family, sensor histidine kinase and response regulator PixL
MTDPTIREQSYRYFLQEAPELLQVLEQELLSLREDYSINKIHNLMRTTHTLKGAAASIGLETIQTVAHSLEDIFKALFNPDLSIDPEIEALIFEGYECLRLPLIAELTGGQVNDTEILDRTAVVFAQLQEKLGDCFGQEAHLPSSVELGFDLTQSIFEVGVKQRLDELATALTRGNPEEVAATLRTQAEVFIGLAESLNLPGFAAIAQASIAALDTAPEQALIIAQTALSDFQAAQAAVLNGDRTQGGQPSLTLQQFAGLTISSSDVVVNHTESLQQNKDFVNNWQSVPTVETNSEFGLPIVEQDAVVEIVNSGEEGDWSDIIETDFSSIPLSEEDIQWNEVGTWGQGETEQNAPPDLHPHGNIQELESSGESSESEALFQMGVETSSEIFPHPPLSTSMRQIENLPSGESQDVPVGDSATKSELGEGTNTTDTDSSLSELRNIESLLQSQTEKLANTLLESIWGGQTILEAQTSAQSNPASSPDREQSPDRTRFTSSQPASATNSVNWSLNEPDVTVKSFSSQSFQGKPTPPSTPQKEVVSGSRTVRVNVEHLEHLNSSVGELLTNHNRQSLQNEQLRTTVRTLLVRLQKHQQLLDHLQDWSDRQFIDAEQRQMGTRWQVEHSNQPTNLQLATPIERFDSLELDRYSEAQIIVQSILEDAVQLAEATEAIDLFTSQSHQTLEKQRRLLTGTRDALMQARMLPLGDIFERFHRVLRQLEIRHSKQVGLELRGTDVLVDKIVAEKLYDPLLHLVRNAFDHGIESPEVRKQRGKQKTGKIEIRASYQGRYLVIEVRDDGQGLDFEQIHQQAIERQLVDAARASYLDRQQLIDLLFEPGFSTVSQVNELSGRGIGLDVVRAQLQSLSGSVAVYSEPQRGTAFILKIPLSLTIAKLLLCQTGDKMYALLTDAIEQILIPQPHQLQCWEGGKVLRWGKDDGEHLIPIYQLSNVLNYSSHVGKSLVSPRQVPFVPQDQGMPVILIRHGDKLLGLEVDQLMGEQELVIRPLGGMIAPPTYVYGSSILADGQLTLVFDGAALVGHVFDQQANSSLESLPYSNVLGTRNALLKAQQDSKITDALGYAQPSRHLPSAPSPTLTSRKQQRLLPAQISVSAASSPTELDIQAKPNPMILIVDDSITVRQTLALTLQHAGYQVLQAKDGYEAIALLGHHLDIQLILCDIEMPRMNGFEFLKHRQQDPALLNIPVVILTSRSASKHRLIASELGATDYITKPYLEHKLLATVKEMLEKKNLNSVMSVEG